MKHVNIMTRRGFLDRSMKISAGIALATLTDIPFAVKRALAEGNIGLNGKKLLFIFLRGANDSLNSVIPLGDPAYNTTNRPSIIIKKDPNAVYSQSGGSCFDPTQFADFAGTARTAADATFSYDFAIPLGNGFTGLHPSLKFLAPVYNSGDLVMIHRVGYPNQSRSHFDSQNYWETGAPNAKLVTDGILYRAMIQSGLANSAPLTAVSIQSALPKMLQGSAAAMTNLTDPTRFNLLGVPNTSSGNYKADSAIKAALAYPAAGNLTRDLIQLQYQNLSNTLPIFASIDFSDAGNTFVDNINTDGDVPYYLFPNTNAKNGGANLNGRVGDTNKYVVDTGGYGFFTNLKAAALILNKTDAIVAGTEFGGFDTHNSQGASKGTHANLQRRIAWAMYGLQKFFKTYGKGGPSALPGAKVSWDDLIVVTMSEFGRTTVENGSFGTDHAEAGAMFLAGGGVKGYGKGNTYGLFGGSNTDPLLPWVLNGPTGGSMFGAGGRYLKRCVDYRQVMGKIIRDHLGATQSQLNQIIPGYGNPAERLIVGGTSIDSTDILPELPFI
jgi:uncharacterized protein (DUF1501 family)